MRKQILFALALILGLSTAALAQVTNEGTITTTGAATCVTANSCVRLPATGSLPANSGAVSIQLGVTAWTGTVTIETTTNGTDYVTAQGCTAANAAVTTMTANGQVQCNVSGLSKIQVRGTAAFTGTLTVKMTSSVAAAKNVPPAAGPGSGTVTSIATTSPIGGGTITTTGTITCATCVVGPASAVDSNLAVYDGTTGKLLKDGGIPITPGSVTIGGPGNGNGAIKFKGNTSGTVTMTVNTIAGTWTWELPTNDGDANQFLKTDGNGVTSWASPVFDAVWSFPGTPGGSTTYPFFVAASALTFPDDFAGSVCKVLTNPTATWTLTVEKNGSAVGTVGVATNGVCTFATSGGATTLAAGDYLTMDTPAADATLADVMFTFAGTRG